MEEFGEYLHFLRGSSPTHYVSSSLLSAELNESLNWHLYDQIELFIFITDTLRANEWGKEI